MLVTKCNAHVRKTDGGDIFFRCITLQLQLLQLQPLLQLLRDMKRNAYVGKTHGRNNACIVSLCKEGDARYRHIGRHGHGVNVKRELGDDISTKLLHHVSRPQFSASWL